MAKWFYTIDGKNHGPVNDRRLADAILRGDLDMDATVMSGDNGLWRKIRDIPEVMQIIHKPLPKPVFSDVAAGEFKEFISSDVELSEYYPVFYNLPAKKLLIMQLVTLGLFEIYWFYKQWQFLSSHRRKSRANFFRALFMFPLFAYEIFRQIDSDRELMKVKRAPWNPVTLALIWYLVVPGMFFSPVSLIPYIDRVVSFAIIATLTSLVLVPVQRYINECNEALKRPYDKPSFGFWFITVLAVGLILLQIWGYIRMLIG